MEVVFIIAGLLFAVIGGYFLYDTYNFRKISKQVRGRLLGYESHISKSKKGVSTTMYTPVVEFVCNGETYSFKSSIASSNMPYQFGATVPVLYLESDPHDARIRTNLRYTLGGIFALIGSITTVVGVATFRYDKISLAIAAVVTGYMVYKGLKFKAKLKADGIHTLDDLKTMVTKTGAAVGGSTINNLAKSEEKNYQSSENLIRQQADVKKRQPLPKWAATAMVLIGISFLSGGAFWAQKRADFFAVAETTHGRVVSMESSYSDGSTIYYPIVNYTFPESNQSVRFKHSVGSSHPGWRTGDVVTVLYNPDDKNDAMIDDGWLNWLGPAILTGMGVILFLVGVAASRRRNRLR